MNALGSRTALSPLPFPQGRGRWSSEASRPMLCGPIMRRSAMARPEDRDRFLDRDRRGRARHALHRLLRARDRRGSRPAPHADLGRRLDVCQPFERVSFRTGHQPHTGNSSHREAAPIRPFAPIRIAAAEARGTPGKACVNG
jgi:hypothetical protein